MDRYNRMSQRSMQKRPITFNALKFRNILSAFFISATVFLFTGASGIDGVALFEKGNYSDARQVFSDALAEKPDDPRSQFYMGRTYLALEEADIALPYLTKATQLDPDNAVYYFWLGVNYWALLDLDRELASYEKALAIDPNLLPAHVYAGHNQLDRGQWEPALAHYATVLQVLPEHPEALFNAGVALEALDREEEAIAVWRRFLQHHCTERLAADAARNLNTAGDFSYRAYPVGGRFIAGPSPGFVEATSTMDPQLTEVMDQIGRVILDNDALTLHIVTFAENNPELAQQRAKTIKQAIRGNFPEIPPGRVRLSWFGQAETVQINDHTYRLKESLNLFTAKAEGQAP